MRFILDNNIPPRLVSRLVDLGHDSVHVQNTAKGSDTEDPEIGFLADAQDRIVLTKDKDFHKLHMITGSPKRVVMIRLGNCSMNYLWSVLSSRLGELEKYFADGATVIEVYPHLTAFSAPRRDLE